MNRTKSCSFYRKSASRLMIKRITAQKDNINGRVAKNVRLRRVRTTADFSASFGDNAPHRLNADLSWVPHSPLRGGIVTCWEWWDFNLDSRLQVTLQPSSVVHQKKW